MGVSEVTRQQEDEAWAQLGSSGSGNHFVEYGELEVKTPVLDHEPGHYLALLSAWLDLRGRGVELLSAGLDEAPMAYEDIDEVMAAQRDLVEPVARFEPRIVKMAPAGERPED